MTPKRSYTWCRCGPDARGSVVDGQLVCEDCGELIASQEMRATLSGLVALSKRLPPAPRDAKQPQGANGRAATIDRSSPGLALTVPSELVEAIARRAAELVAEREPSAEDGWLRGADRIAAYIDSPPSRVYALASARRIPIHRDGSALIARRSELDAWLRNGGGVRT